MRRWLEILIMPIALVCIIGVLAWILPEVHERGGPRTMRDAWGVTVKLPEQPQRVMATSSALDIVLLNFLPPARIPTVQRDTKSPWSSLIWETARQVKGNLTRSPAAEEIVVWNPDIVFMPDYTSDDIVNGVRAMGIPVVVVTTPKTVYEVHDMVDQVGFALNDMAKAKEIKAKFDAQVAESIGRRDTIPKDEWRKVIFMSSMVGYGGTGSLFADANRYSGLINAAEASGIPDHTAFTEERLLLMDPDVIFIPNYSNKPSKMAETMLNDPALAPLSAVKHKRILPLRPAYLYNSSTGLPEGIAAAQAVGYRDRFPELAAHYEAPVPEPGKNK